MGTWSLESEPRGRSTVLPSLMAPVTDNLGMDGARNTVVKLSVKLGKLVASVHTGLGDVPHGSSFDNVPDDVLLNGLVFGYALSTVSAAHGLDMTSTVLVPAIVAALRCHSENTLNKLNFRKLGKRMLQLYIKQI